MSAPLERIEVWSDLACNSGVAKADLPIIDATACTVVEEIINSLVQRRLTVTVPLLWADQAELVLRRVLRVVYSDSTGFDEFRIHRLTRSAVGGTITIEARGIEFDLGERDTLISTTVNGQLSLTVSDAVTTATTTLTSRTLAALPGYWALGTITPTDTIDVAYSNDTPLSGALKVVTAVKAVSGTAYEISVRRNGTTGYYLEITIYNTAATAPDLLQAKSLVDLRVLDDTQDHATRIYGSEGAYARPTYQVSTVTANTWIEVQEVNGMGGGPAREDTQWANYYWIEQKNGTAHQITACTKQSFATTRLSMASTATIVAADRGYLALNSSGDDVPYVESPSLQTTWGINVKQLPTSVPAFTNYILNADMRNGTGSAPTSWTVTGTASSVTRITTAGRWKTGTASYRILNGFGIGAGNLAQTQTVNLKVGDVVAYGAWLYVNLLTTAGATAALTFTDPNGTANYTVKLDGTDATVNQLGRWYWITATFAVATTGNKTIGVSVTQSTIPASGVDVYLDSGCACYSRSGAGLSAVVIGSLAATNAATANRYFDVNGTPPASYEVSVLDLYRMDPTGVGVYESLSLGGTANVTDTDLGVTVSPRVVRVETNHLTAHDTRIILSTQTRELTRVLAA